MRKLDIRALEILFGFRISKFGFYFLLLTAYCLLVTGCGKKEPCGYDIVKDRAGKIDTIVVSPDSLKTKIYSYLEPAGGLFVGNENGFTAKSFLIFEIPDTVDSCKLKLYKQEGEGSVSIYKTEIWEQDSLIWGNEPDRIIDTSIASFTAEESIFVTIDTIYLDTLFAISLESKTDSMIRFSSPCLIIYHDTLEPISPLRYGFTDTLCSQDTLFQVVTGNFIISDSIFFSFYISDSATIADATLSFAINTDSSYKYEQGGIRAKSGSYFSEFTDIIGDTLKISCKSIVQEWCGDQEHWLILEPSTSIISRTILKFETGKLNILWTMPPESRF